VYVTETVPCPVAAGSTAPSTAVALGGFSLPTTGFTAYWSGKVPTTPLLEMACAQSHTNTAATRTSATVTRVFTYSQGCDGVTNAFAGHRLLGNVNSQTATFGNYGLAISASTSTSGNITSVTTTGSPCTVTCSAAHGLATGDYVTLSGFTTTPVSINGTFQITVVDATHFSVVANVTAASDPIGTFGGVHDITHATHGQASGSWTQIDIVCPSAAASAQPIFALANTDRSRLIAVYLDCLDGTIKTRYWNGSAWGSYATITGFFFTPEYPVHVALSYDGAGTLTIRASAGGQAVASTTLSVTPDQALTQMIAGDGTSVAPMEWWGGMVTDRVDSSTQSLSILQTLRFQAFSEEIRNPTTTLDRFNP